MTHLPKARRSNRKGKLYKIIDLPCPTYDINRTHNMVSFVHKNFIIKETIVLALERRVKEGFQEILTDKEVCWIYEARLKRIKKEEL